MNRLTSAGLKLIGLDAPERLERLVASLLILFFSVHIWSYYASNEVYLNAGDGLHHYLIAKWSFAHPALILDHWGKPLFTLFAAPFAQLGIHAMVLMNIMASATAAMFGYLALKRLGNQAALIFIPVLYGSSIYYFQTASAGMTEVFMSMLVAVLLWCWSTRKWTAFAIIASFLPYARPAGYLILVLAGGGLAADRKWKKLPLLLTGTVLFGLVGWPLYGTPLWFFTNDPYVQAADFYGKGDDLFHFISKWDYIYGEALVGVAAVGLLMGLIFFKHRIPKKVEHRIYLFAFLGAIGAMAVHSYLWWKGGLGSLGLIRVLASVSPLAAFSVFWLWERLNVGRFSSIIFTVTLTVVLSYNNHYTPVLKPKENQVQEMIITSMKMIEQDFGLEGRYFAALHPIVPVYTHTDPWEPAEGGLYNFAGLARNPEKHLEPGDIVIWEAALTAPHSGVALAELQGNHDFSIIHWNTTREYNESLDGNTVTLAAFAYKGEELVHMDTLLYQRMDTITSSDEFYNLEGLNRDISAYSGLRLVCEASSVTGSPLLVVASESSGEFYRSIEIGKESHCVIRMDKSILPLKIYIWNQARQTFTVEGMKVYLEALSPVNNK